MNLADRAAIFMEKVLGEPNSGCWLWMGSTNHGGYGNFWHAGKSLKAHRFSYMAFVGEIPASMDIMHKCDTPACVNPSHLRAATTRENVRDAWAKGRMKDRSGALNGRAKLTDDGAQRIRDMAAVGYKTAVIAQKFEMNPSSIRRVVRGDWGKNAH